MKTLKLIMLLLCITFALSCNQQSAEKKPQIQTKPDSTKIDSTASITNEKYYPPEPEGYKGIHQQEKEKHDRKL